MLEHFWYAVGWTIGSMIAAGFQVLVWAIDIRNASEQGWRRLDRIHLPLLGSRPD
jgi:hypothetical protein